MADAEESEPAEELVERVAAIDIAKASGMVCMRVPHHSRTGRRTQEVWNVPAIGGSRTTLSDGWACSSALRNRLRRGAR